MQSPPPFSLSSSRPSQPGHRHSDERSEESPRSGVVVFDHRTSPRSSLQHLLSLRASAPPARDAAPPRMASLQSDHSASSEFDSPLVGVFRAQQADSAAAQGLDVAPNAPRLRLRPAPSFADLPPLRLDRNSSGSVGSAPHAHPQAEAMWTLWASEWDKCVGRQLRHGGGGDDEGANGELAGRGKRAQPFHDELFLHDLLCGEGQGHEEEEEEREEHEHEDDNDDDEDEELSRAADLAALEIFVQRLGALPPSAFDFVDHFQCHLSPHKEIKTPEGEGEGGEGKEEDEEEDDQGPCSVCLDDLHDGDACSGLACGHVFHRACLQEWCKRSLHCPNCRFNASRPPPSQRYSSS